MISKSIIFIFFWLLRNFFVNAQNDSTQPPYPAPGKLFDIGGWRLHLNCTGQSTDSLPTVILEAGLGDFSVEWSLVQPEIARFTQVCSYDRAGDGWSDWGPFPRTFQQIVYELHTLLSKAGLKPPFVLVGHSYGGWLVRLFKFTYPNEVAGMVLIDAGANDPWRKTANGKLVRSSTLVKEQTVPAVKTSSPLKISDIPADALNQIKAGLPQLSAHANDSPRNKLPAKAQQMRSWALSQIGHVVATVNPFENEELAGLRAEQAKSKYPLGNMPLTVLARGLPDENGSNAKELEDDHRKDLQAMAMLSRKGKLVIAERSGHHIQLDEPDLVIRSIHEVLEMVRKN